MKSYYNCSGSTAVVVGPGLLTESLCKDIIVFVKNCPDYVFIFQFPSSASTLYLLGSGLPAVPLELAEPEPRIDRGVLRDHLKGVDHCVFAELDFSFTSSRGAHGPMAPAEHSSTGVQTAQSQEVYELLSTLTLVNVIGDLLQHVALMNWAIGRLADLRSKVYTAETRLKGDPALLEGLPGIEPSRGRVALSIVDVLDGRSSEFKAFCEECSRSKAESVSKKRPIEIAQRVRRTEPSKLVYIHDSGYLTLDEPSALPGSSAGANLAPTGMVGTRQNSIAKLLSFSSYYYGGGASKSSEDMSAPKSPHSKKTLFDYDAGDNPSKLARANLSRKSISDTESSNLDPAVSWVPQFPLDHFTSGGDRQSGPIDDLSRQNSLYLPLLSQISTISQSGEPTPSNSLAREAGSEPSSWEMHHRISESQIDSVQFITQDDTLLGMLSQETDETVMDTGDL